MATPLTADQIGLVQASWGELVPRAYAFSSMFYQRLFEVDPGAEELFRGRTRAEQSGKFIAMLGIMVRNLASSDELSPVTESLGSRHREYGVTAMNYLRMEEALLWTLEGMLGSGFGPDTRAAWRAAYACWLQMMEVDSDREPAIQG